MHSLLATAVHGQAAAADSICAAVVLQMIKDQMDKKFGSPWHVIVGKAFAYEITYEVRQQQACSMQPQADSWTMLVCLNDQHNSKLQAHAPLCDWRSFVSVQQTVCLLHRAVTGSNDMVPATLSAGAASVLCDAALC
jgi:hypothetical protein